MAKIKIGDIFEIKTAKGRAYLHYVHKDGVTGEMVRVLKGIYSDRPPNCNELAVKEEKFIISFPLSSAAKQKIVELVGHQPVSDFCKPKFMRSEHIIRGEFLGWHIINTETWQRELVKSLTPDQKKLSPWGIWNDTLLVQNLDNDWSLENWG